MFFEVTMDDALWGRRGLGDCPLGAVAQLGERLLCKQEVTSSILVGSTSFGAMRLGGA